MAISRDQARGMLLGLAVGDAVGTTVEFRRRGSFAPVTDMTGGGPFGLAAGEWTDDTAMAICLAESLVECGGWDAADCMDRFVAWSTDGYASCTGSCFDIGMTISAALSRYRRTGQPYSGSIDPRSSGNGAIMRLAPAVIALADAPKAAIRLAVLQGRLTHASNECDLYAARLARLLMAGNVATAEGALPDGTIEADVSSSGYVRHTYEAAVWAVATTPDFRSAVLRAVNLGDDADTVGAVTGQIAGSIYGASAIPPRWLERLAWRDRIEKLADSLFEGSIAPPPAID